MMLLLLSLVFAAHASAQSLVASVSSDSRTNTCLRRSVFVYTQDSSTYVVTNIGATSFPAGPTVCPNVSVSTVYASNRTVTRALPASTVTVFQEPTSASPSVIADAGFEQGQDNPFNTSASDPSVSAEVATSGTSPLQPYSGDSFLLITFNNSASPPPRVKRQETTPQVYNVTQNFAAVAGSSYRLSAYAAQAPNGDNTPACSITICGDNTCGPSTAITAQYSPYIYQYNPGVTETGAVATFSVSCPQSAYVALDNVTVSSAKAAAVSLTPTTTTVVRYVTETQSLQGATQTETTQQVATPPTQIVSITNTVSTRLVSTATQVVSVPQTEYINVTFSDISTTTTTITRTLQQTTTVNQPPSLIYETATATTTALVTFTDHSVSLQSATPLTMTTSERTTLQITTTLPGVTQTPPASTQYSTEYSTRVSTSIVFSTVIQTTYVSVTLPQATESYPYTLPQATESVPYTLPQATESITLPQATYTPPPETTYITVTLPASTITSYISVTPSPVTEYHTLTATPATQTLQITQTLPASTLRFTDTATLPASTVRFTDTATLPASTLRFTQTTTPPASTLPASTVVQTFTLSGSTITQTLTLFPSTTQTTTTRTTTTTSTTSTTTTTSTTRTTTTTTTTSSSSSSSSSSSVPTPTAAGVPAVYLSRPTNIAGNAYTGSPTDYDDDSFTVALPFPVYLYGRSNANLEVTSNGVLGLGVADTSYGNGQLPNYQGDNYYAGTTTFLDTGVLAFWEDLMIYQGTQQGIFYQIDSTSPTRQVTIEYYLSQYGDPSQYYHFLVKFFENRPNVVTLQYLNVSDHGSAATVGVESYSAGNKWLQYSNYQAIIYPGLQITFNTASGNGAITVDSPGTP